MGAAPAHEEECAKLPVQLGDLAASAERGPARADQPFQISNNDG